MLWSPDQSSFSNFGEDEIFFLVTVGAEKGDERYVVNMRCKCKGRVLTKGKSSLLNEHR